jgi:catechol 2,3-dioxygenase-like lactoylglutathione lyase family enzyme
MTINHVQLVSVPVSDVDRARAFYVDQLGMELIRDNRMGPAQRWVQVGPKGGQASLTLVTWFDTMPAGSLRGLVLHTDDLDADVAELAGRGVRIDDGIRQEPWGRYVTFADPDGNGIVLQTPTAPPGR